MPSLLPEANFAGAPHLALRDGQNWTWSPSLTLWPDAGLRQCPGVAAGGPVLPRGHSTIDTCFPRPPSAVPAGSSGSRSPWQGCPLLSQGSPGALRCCRSSGYCEEAGPRTSKPWAEAPFCWGDGRPLQALPHARVGAVGDKAPDVPPPLPGQQAQRLLGEHTRENAAGSVLEPQHLGAGSK